MTVGLLFRAAGAGVEVDGFETTTGLGVGEAGLGVDVVFGVETAGFGVTVRVTVRRGDAGVVTVTVLGVDGAVTAFVDRFVVRLVTVGVDVEVVPELLVVVGFDTTAVGFDTTAVEVGRLTVVGFGAEPLFACVAFFGLATETFPLLADDVVAFGFARSSALESTLAREVGGVTCASCGLGCDGP